MTMMIVTLIMQHIYTKTPTVYILALAQGSVSQRLRSTVSWTSPFHRLLSPCTALSLSRDVQIMVTNLQNLHFLIFHY